MYSLVLPIPFLWVNSKKCKMQKNTRIMDKKIQELKKSFNIENIRPIDILQETTKSLRRLITCIHAYKYVLNYLLSI